MEILQYTGDNLAYALQNKHTTKSQVLSKHHFRYLTDYFAPGGLHARHIVIEDQYINKDYLSDYAIYYSTCFVPYDKVCKRIHFFSIEFTEAELKAAIVSGDHAHIWDAYLGFIVVKPIPVTIIGFTLFKTFPEGDRKFFGTREYKVHFFGKEIQLCSLAFQEQDNVLSACATSAIWSMLNKASLDYHTTLRTPNEITRSAGLTGPDGSRLFPNKQGLSLIQMCEAILDAGLVTEIRQVAGDTNFDWNYVKELIAAYSAIGIPIILVISVLNTDDRRKRNDLSLHAVTVAGFNQPAFTPRVRQPEIQLTSETVTKLYVHDDQWGPFARMTFNTDHGIEGPWELLGRGYTNVENVLIPVFPKIRIAYDDVKNVITSIDKLLYLTITHFKMDFCWEIKLELSETYKNYIRSSALNADVKFAFLTMSCPKYIWRATCFYTDVKICDMIFDATDVSANMFAREIVFYEDNVKTFLRDLFNVRDDFRTLFRNDKYFDFFKTKVQ